MGKGKAFIFIAINFFVFAMLMPKHVERQSMCQKALKRHISTPQMG